MESFELGIIENIHSIDTTATLLRIIIRSWVFVGSLGCSLLELLVNIREVLSHIAEIFSFKYSYDAEWLCLDEVRPLNWEQNGSLSKETSLV